MTRKGKAKVRSGCLTCKVRRVKCDESKPNCSRCMSTGRTCDGYYQHVYSVLEPQPSQALQTLYSRPGDARAVEFFSIEVAHSFWAPHNSFFWTDHVLQLSHHAEAIRHSVIAVSFVYEECSVHGAVPAQLRHNEFFLRHFNSAVRLLRATKDQHLVLIGCLLFVCIEAIQRNHEQASLHAKHGVRIFQALKTTDGWVHDTLGAIFRRVSTMPLFSGQNASPSAPAQFRSIDQQPVSISEAEAVLEGLVGWMGRLSRCGEAYRHGALRGKLVPAGLLAVQQDIQEHIERVRSMIAQFDGPAVQSQHKDAWYLAVVIRAEICRIRTLQAFDPDETNYDQFSDTWRAITQFAHHPGCALRMLADNVTGTDFQSEVGYTQAIYFITTKCRDLATRLRTLKLLRKHSRLPNEGNHDLNKLYLYSRRIIEVEHDITLNRWDQPIGQVAWEELPPENKRVLGTFAEPYDVIRVRTKGRVLVGKPEGFIVRSSDGGLRLRVEFITVVGAGDNDGAGFIQLENSLTRQYSPAHETIEDTCAV